MPLNVTAWYGSTMGRIAHVSQYRRVVMGFQPAIWRRILNNKSLHGMVAT